jgi:diacylglycerol O-acyltransferase
MPTSPRRRAAARARSQPVASPRRMAATDALFWYAEEALPELRPIIAGLNLLEGVPDRGAAEAVLDRALAAVPRLRQRVVEVPGGFALPEWTDDVHFDRSYHVRHVSLPAPGSGRALLDLSATLLATPLDRQRPLWEAYWIDGREGGGSAFFLKVHHSVVDGVGSIALLDALTAEQRGGQHSAAAPRRKRLAPPPAPAEASRSRALAALRDQALGSVRLAWRAARAPARALLEPGEALADLRRRGRGLGGMLADLQAKPTVDPLVVPGSGLSRRLDVAELPLARLRAVGRPLDATVNDVVLTALAGALRAYHRGRGVHADELSCMVPMNLRGRGEHDALGNRVGMFRIALPVGESKAERRLARVVTQTRAAKSDRRAAAAPLVVDVLTLLPSWAMAWLGRRAVGRVNVACTNVPGVAEPRWIAGVRIESIFPFASVVQGTPLVMALLSYAGTMEVGIDTDPEAIPDPEHIAQLFLTAVEELAALPARSG